MRPSHYHYLKRMWTRKLYSRSQHKVKRRSLLTAPFRFLFWFYTFPFRLILYPISLFCSKSNITVKGCAMLFGGLIGGAFSIGILIYIISNFYYLFGFGPIILLFALPIFVFIRKKAQTQATQDQNIMTTELKNDESISKGESSKSIDMSLYDIERYAIMCNAHLEHEEEMAQYKQTTEDKL